MRICSDIARLKKFMRIIGTSKIEILLFLEKKDRGPNQNLYRRIILGSFSSKGKFKFQLFLIKLANRFRLITQKITRRA
jgi:hypothetical protein